MKNGSGGVLWVQPRFFCVDRLFDKDKKMDEKLFELESVRQVIVLGTGTAGYAAAWRLHHLGVKNIAVIGVQRTAGTGRNAGSDKQTYYRLSQAGAARDSVPAMAADLFSGGAMDGDLAYTEAALSARCFYALCELGVDFPQDEWGGYTGYKTDHDPAARGSSVGPYTSRSMTEGLEQAVLSAGIPVIEDRQAVQLLKDGERVVGLLCITQDGRYVAYGCGALVAATGGPADLWQNSVYPQSQTGASGLVFAAGAPGRNLTEWQFGLASIAPRWNVSGSYMQVLPRIFSRDERGTEYEFLGEDGLFADEADALSNLFLKGYQWPFDASRAKEGSSRIDLAVSSQQQLGRQVFLDYTREPFGHMPDWQVLSREAFSYLEKAGALLETPIARLRRLNALAVAFYAEHGVDLASEPLEISLCVQHCNGGIAVNDRWQTPVPGLWCVGEAAGTHGVRRPGGSALNAGQVGALRAAQSIAEQNPILPTEKTVATLAQAAVEAFNCSAAGTVAVDLQEELLLAQKRMSDVAGVVRCAANLQQARIACEKQLARLVAAAPTTARRPLWHRLRQLLVTQQTVLFAMEDYAQRVGISRGSALYQSQDGRLNFAQPGIPGRAKAEETDLQEITWSPDGCAAHWRKVHPLPVPDDCFENVWRAGLVSKNGKKDLSASDEKGCL